MLIDQYGLLMQIARAALFFFERQVITGLGKSKKWKIEWDYFLDPATGRRKYNDICRKCKRDCKQSFRALLINCRNYVSKRSKKGV